MVDIARHEGVHNNHCYLSFGSRIFQNLYVKKSSPMCKDRSVFDGTINYNAQRQVTLNLKQ